MALPEGDVTWVIGVLSLLLKQPDSKPVAKAANQAGHADRMLRVNKIFIACLSA